MPQLPLVGRGIRSRSLRLSPGLLINAYPEAHPGKLSNASISNTPNLQLFKAIDSNPIRAFHEVKGIPYALVGTKLYELEANGNPIDRGDIPGTFRPKVDDNGKQIVFPVGDKAYVYTIATQTVSEITDADYTPSESCCFVGRYIDFTRKNTGIHYLSAIDDATDIDALDFAEAEAVPDNLIANHQFQSNAWLFGTKSTEVWFVDVTAFPLTRYQNGAYNVGCGARLSIASNEDVIIWLTNNRRVYLSNGGKPVPISDPDMEYELGQLSSVADGEAFIYTEEGHTFYELSFTQANRTFVYDLTENYWHERQSSGGRHLASFHVKAYGKHLVGDYQTGNIYEMSLDHNDENGSLVIRQGIIPPISSDSAPITINKLQLIAETGITPLNEPEDENGIQLRWSENGEDWGNWIFRPFGAKGKRNTKLTWDGLGAKSDWYFQWRTSIKAPVRIIKALINDQR